MRIAIAATPSIAIPAIERLTKFHEIAFLLTQPDKPFGRGQEVHESDVAQWGRRHGLKVFKSLEECADLASVDLVITIAYGVLIPESYLAQPRHGFVNLHYSLLPRWRGAAPVQRALLAGDEQTGVTVFQLEKGMDTGPIYVQHKIAIDPEWNSHQLFERLNELGGQALLETIEVIAQGGVPVAQHGSPTYAPKIGKDEFRLNFSRTAEELGNQIRALYPSTFCFYGEKRFKILQASSSVASGCSPGDVVATSPLTIGCGEGTALICEVVQPEGKRAMSAQDWVRGAKIEIGHRFE